MDPIFYTVVNINGDYAEMRTDDGQPHSITMFLLPEGTTVGSRLKLTAEEVVEKETAALSKLRAQQ